MAVVVAVDGVVALAAAVFARLEVYMAADSKVRTYARSDEARRIKQFQGSRPAANSTSIIRMIFLRDRCTSCSCLNSRALQRARLSSSPLRHWSSQRSCTVARRREAAGMRRRSFADTRKEQATTEGQRVAVSAQSFLGRGLSS